MMREIGSTVTAPLDPVHLSAQNKFYNPKTLKELASAAIPLPESAKPLSGMGIPTRVISYRNGNRKISSVMGRDCLVSHMCVPTVAQLFKDIKFEKKPKIAIVPFYLDQLGDIKIVLVLREIIKKSFGVEPLFILNLDILNRTQTFLHNSKDNFNFKCIDQETITDEDCKNLDLLIHGPAIYLFESCEPSALLKRYPKLNNSIDWNNPPKIISVLEAESPNFSFSAVENHEYKNLKQLIALKSDLKDISDALKKKGLLDEHHYHSYARHLPLIVGGANEMRDRDPEQFELYCKIYEIFASILNNPSNDPLNGLEIDKFVIDTTIKLEEIWQRIISKIPRSNFKKTADTNFCFSLSPWSPNPKPFSILSGVESLHEFQVGINSIFSLGCFPLTEKIGKWKKNGLLDTPEGRKQIFDNIGGHMTAQDTEVLLALSGKRYILGYGHNTEVKKRFVDEARAANPFIKDAVINMSFNIAVSTFFDYTIIDHESGQQIEGNLPFTVHLYSKISNPIFEELMAASDPCCRLAGGDNSFFTSLIMGSDDLFYELRSFKQGMILALFQLANELPIKEKNCIVDRMLGNIDNKLLEKTKVIVPGEYQAWMERKTNNALSKPGSDLFRRAFRNIGRMMYERSEHFNDTLGGLLKFQVVSRRNPEDMQELDKLIGGPKDFFKGTDFKAVKTYLDSKLAVQPLTN